MTEEISLQKPYVTRSSEGPPSLSNLNALRLTVDAHHRASFQLLPELLKVSDEFKCRNHMLTRSRKIQLESQVIPVHNTMSHIVLTHVFIT